MIYREPQGRGASVLQHSHSILGGGGGSGDLARAGSQRLSDEVHRGTTVFKSGSMATAALFNQLQVGRPRRALHLMRWATPHRRAHQYFKSVH